MALVWKAPDNVFDLVNQIKLLSHPVLHNNLASIAVCFTDAKPFIKNRFNWGNVTKFNDFNRIWMGNKYDFCIHISSDVWHNILTNEQREALIDLHLERCKVEFVPQTIVENGKKIVVKDDLGRVQYTDEIKVDEDGNPKWVVEPFSLSIFAKNIKRYGLWCSMMDDLKSIVKPE